MELRARLLVRPPLDKPRDEGGASLVEYALLVALIAVAALVGIMFFGDQLGGSYSSIGSSVRAA